MSDNIPARTTDLDEVPIEELTNLIVVNDTGSVLNYFPNAKGAYSDHTGKEYTTRIFDKDGEEHTIYCGLISFAGKPTEEAVPTPSEIIEDHQPFGNDGEYNWGRIV